ncbi:DUF488 domain-containing protein [Sphingomonadaceae bacterium OTU29THOMA1]|nr:DUF488 domain-containing protein [Sphingomonadaceae bacterium OTU29THOMA1]
MGRLFTIGYSGLDMPGFIDRLVQNGIAVVCDVRSTPFSKFKPDFTRGPFRAHLNAAGIKYVFLGRELGARPQDRSCYVDGQARYDRIAATEPFRLGMDRVRNGVAKTTLALVCSERDPVECHRAILVAHRLGDLRDTIAHIHTDGQVESQSTFDARLVALHGLTPPPLLSAPGDDERALALAYEKQADAIAYRERG